MRKYDHKEIEKRWQDKWEADGLYRAPDHVEGKENFYTLFEFPYPSGNLHVGHWYAFANTDIYTRFKRMKGYNVLYPIGFDSFGLPAENAAIKRGLDPKEWTYSNIEYMKGQIRSMGTSLDWSREIRTSDPEYYKWTQWIFTQFYEKGLVYRGEATVNWCPSCQTVLANEQVVGGLCERCDTEIEHKTMKQWMYRITAYADRLIDDLKDLDWPEEIKQSQINWIGRSEGALITFALKNSQDALEVFTTRPDTLFGVTYIVIAPEHPLISTHKEHISNLEEVTAYVRKAIHTEEIERVSEEKEKTGVRIEGLIALHPATGEEIPVYVADYVLGSYGTGAVMAVPAHDERDYLFAQQYRLPIKQVISSQEEELCYTGEGTLINSDVFTGLSSKEAYEKIIQKFGKKTTTYKLRDWSIGRQRYWGCPIPIVYDPEGNPHTIPFTYLPWELPSDVDHKPSGEAPLARSQELKKRTEEIFGEGWTPEVETMDTFVDSSWYYLRYLDPHNSEEFSSLEKQQAWMPVDFYSGGAEHTTMHLLYARFFFKALSDLGLVTEHEPFKKRMNRGLILGPDGAKMSKSRGNVIDPDDQVHKVGADSVRMYLAFIGPYNEVGHYPWDVGGIVGVRRFLERVWQLKSKVIQEDNVDQDLEQMVHRTIKKVGEEIESLKLNTSVSALMEFVNFLNKRESISQSIYETLLILLSPFAPHITEELWYELGHTDSIHYVAWPSYDENKLLLDTVTITIQVNGKVRGVIEVSRTYSEEDIVHQARKTVSKWLADTQEQKVIVVPNRLVNFVVSAS